MIEQPAEQPWLVDNRVGWSTTDTITIRGYDLADDLLGEVDFGALFYLLATGRKPSSGEAAMFNACLVALADHGLTPSAIAARLTLLGAPDAVQGAIAAGVLGAGSKFLGVFEDAGRMLTDATPTELRTDDDFTTSAVRIVDTYAASGRLLPGIGHPNHKQGDPRTKRLFELATIHHQDGPYGRLLRAVHQVAQARTDRPLPINAAGACGAALCDIGIPVDVLRGVAVVSRAAGLVGHIVDERERPMAQAVWFETERAAERGRAAAKSQGARR